MNKKIIAIAVILVLLVIVGYTYLRPTKSQEILIYTSNSGIDLMLQKSAAKYEETHNVKITWVSPGGSGATVQKVIQEKDNPQADICVASIPSHIAAKDAGALEKYTPPNAAHIPDAFKDPEGYFTGWFAFYNCFTNHVFWFYHSEDFPLFM